MPDEFNDLFTPALLEHIPSIEEAAAAEDEKFSSYIRALYISVEPMEQAVTYSFEIFALMRSDTPDSVLSNTQETLETLAEKASVSPNLEDRSDMYADRDNNIPVSYLNQFVRLNLDYYSLTNDDDEIGPDEVV